MTKLHLTRRTLLGAALGAAAIPAFAQVKNSGTPLRIIVTLPPGGGMDNLARFLAPKLAEALGRPCIVDSKPGGNAVIGTRAAATAAPNGDTLLLASNSSMVTNVALMPQLPYDPLVDFAPVARLVRYDLVVVVAADSPLRTFADLVAAGKRPGTKLNYGAGTSTYQVVVERLKRAAGFEAEPIPYKGTAPALNDMMGGQIHFTVGDMSSVAALVKGGRVRILTTAAAVRSADLPDVPALADAGIKDIDMFAWLGMFYQSKVDPASIKAVSEALLAIMKTPEGLAFAKAQNGSAYPAGPEEYRKFLVHEIEVTKRVAHAANIRME